MARVVHGYNGKRGNDNRIDDNEDWQELNHMALQNGQEVHVNHLRMSVTGTGIVVNVSNDGVRELLEKMRSKC
jgi:hypothetical protein